MSRFLFIFSEHVVSEKAVSADVPSQLWELMTEDQQILTKQVKPLAPGNSIKVGQLLVFVANYTKILPNEDGEGGEGGEGV